MRKILLGTTIMAIVVASCSTVSSIVQNTFPYNANVVVAAKTPSKQSLSAISNVSSISQYTGTTTNVKDIKITSATVTITSGDQSIGVFKNIKLYLIGADSKEILTAARVNIPDNIGNSLVMDVNSNALFDNILHSGTVQMKMEYELKTPPTSDLKIKSSFGFSSTPISNK